MSVQTVVLRIASIVLPRGHRARWREEASAVLMEVSGVRRLWYTVDTVLKVPVLARQHRRGQPGGQPESLPGRGVSAVVGAALLVSALAAAADLTALHLLRDPGPIGTDVYVEVPDALPVITMSDPFGHLLVLSGLVALVATRAFRSARRPGTGLRYAHSGALLITIFVGAGPVVAWLPSIALNLPIVALVGYVLPGVWLAAVCATALRRRTGPWPLAVLGTVAGLAQTVALVALPLLAVMPGHQPAALLIGHWSLLVGAALSYLVWSGWAGVRLLFGRQDLLMARPPTPDRLRPDEAR
jgi:hypothetical protein